MAVISTCERVGTAEATAGCSEQANGSCMDEQATDREGGVEDQRVKRMVFGLRHVFIVVALFAGLFYVVHRHLEIGDYDIDAKYSSLQGRRVFLEKLKKQYDTTSVDKKHVAYVGLEKSIKENDQEIKDLKWTTKPNPED